MYRWWTVNGWSDQHGAGVKLGPITLVIYAGPERHELFIGAGGRWAVLDTGTKYLFGRRWA